MEETTEERRIRVNMEPADKLLKEGVERITRLHAQIKNAVLREDYAEASRVHRLLEAAARR